MRSGFSLIEALVAIAVLVIGVMGVLGLYIYVGDSSKQARNLNAGTLLAEQTIAILETEARTWLVGAEPPADSSLASLRSLTVGGYKDFMDGKQVNVFGSRESDIDASYSDITPYCIYVQVVYKDGNMVSGGVRVIWSKVQGEECIDQDPADFDTPSKLTQSFGFVTIPFAVRAQG